MSHLGSRYSQSTKKKSTNPQQATCWNYFGNLHQGLFIKFKSQPQKKTGTITLPETNVFAPENRPKPNRKGSYSNHPFSGAMLIFGEVSNLSFNHKKKLERLPSLKLTFSPLKIGRNPIGKDRIQTIHSSGVMLIFGEVSNSSFNQTKQKTGTITLPETNVFAPENRPPQ